MGKKDIGHANDHNPSGCCYSDSRFFGEMAEPSEGQSAQQHHINQVVAVVAWIRKSQTSDMAYSSQTKLH